MKSKMLLIVLVFPFILFAQDSTKTHDFRNADWGMSQKEVIKSESIELKPINEDLIGSTTVAGKPVFLCYRFAKGKLVDCSYLFTVKHTNKNDYIQDYLNLKDVMIKKYGAPLTDDVEWLDDLYRNDESEWGFAVSLGHLKYHSGWTTSKTKIIMDLSGENYKLSVMIFYFSKQYELLRESVDEQKDTEDL